MAPVFFSAFLYYMLGQAITTIGPQYSILPSKLYLGVFLTADVISLILQAVGGGQAASSAATSTPTTSATNIMVAGIIFQLVSMAVFIACAIDFFLRARTRRAYAFREKKLAAEAEKKRAPNDRGTSDGSFAHDGSENTLAESSSPSGKLSKEAGTIDQAEQRRRDITRWEIMMIGVGISSAMIFVRGIYRSIELVQGWSGFLISHEIYQNVLDGIPMVIAVAVFNFINPGFVLPRRTSWRGYH